jgi:hypothetical protein
MSDELVPVPEWRDRAKEKASGKAEISERLEAALVTLVSTACTKKQAAETDRIGECGEAVARKAGASARGKAGQRVRGK